MSSWERLNVNSLDSIFVNNSFYYFGIFYFNSYIISATNTEYYNYSNYLQ